MGIANGLIQSPYITTRGGQTPYQVLQGLAKQPAKKAVVAGPKPLPAAQMQGFPAQRVMGGPYQMLAEQMARGRAPTSFQNPLMPPANINPWLLGLPG